MTDKDIMRLKEAIRDYLQWVRSKERRGSKKMIRHGLLLVDFIDFVKEKKIEWEGMFTFDTLILQRNFNFIPFCHSDAFFSMRFIGNKISM